MIILFLIIREFQEKKRNSPLNHPEVLLEPTNQGGGTGKVVTTTASDQQPALDTGLTARDASIVERNGKVNQLADTFAISDMRLTDLTPDFTAPAPEPEIEPLRMDEAAREDTKMFDAEEFGALDMEITRIAGQGRMMPEDAAELEAAKAELERVDKVENAGLSVLECVMRGIK